MLFHDRRDAGRKLAERLSHYANRNDVIVLGLPRGGVPVAYEVAQALRAPLDVFVVRKLGVPGHEELAMGAIATGGVRVVNEEVRRALQLSDEILDRAARREGEELARREHSYRGSRSALVLSGRQVILIDDGLATGSTMRAAVAAVRVQHPARVVVAVPVGAWETCEQLRSQADEVLCAQMPDYFSAVGQWYWDFTQTSDAEVRDLLARAERPPNAA